MALTTSSDLYVPEVWADLAAEAYVGRAVVATSPATLVDDTLAGQPGDTITMPRWNALTELADLSESTPMTPEKLTQRASEAVIKEAGKAVEFTDRASLTGVGNPQDEAIRQFGALAARKVDADLITAALATVTGGVTYSDGTTATNAAPLAATTSGGVDVFGWAQVVQGLALFGDDIEVGDFAGLFIRAEQWAGLMLDDQFIAASQGAGVNGIINGGNVGTVGGMPVFVTNRLPARTAMIAKRNSLGLFYKRRPVVEQDRDILARTTVVATNLHYAAKRVQDKGIVRLNIQAA